MPYMILASHNTARFIHEYIKWTIMWSCLCLCLRTYVYVSRNSMSSSSICVFPLFASLLLRSLGGWPLCLPRRQLDINIVSKIYLRCSFMQISHQLTTQQKVCTRQDSAFKVGVQTDRIVIKPYPDLLLFFGYGSYI